MTEIQPRRRRNWAEIVAIFCHFLREKLSTCSLQTVSAIKGGGWLVYSRVKSSWQPNLVAVIIHYTICYQTTALIAEEYLFLSRRIFRDRL